MSERHDWFSGPVDGVAFALIMVVAAFLGRENPNFIYPGILYCFLGLLLFNFADFSILPRWLAETRRAVLKLLVNIFLLTLVLRCSGGPGSYFWVLFLLPVFNACLSFAARGVLAATAAVLAVLAAFHLEGLRNGSAAEALQLLVKAAIVAASAFVVMRVAAREREARLRLEAERRRMELERARAREQLQRMDRLATLGTLTAGVAHELNTPLTTILGYAQLGLDDTGPALDLPHILGRIEDSVRRCRQIIQDMLAFSRQKTGTRASCDVNQLVRECVALKQHDWLADRISVESRLEADIPPLLLSGSQFQQVIFNLLVNAQQALRAAAVAQGRIVLATRRDGGDVLVSVQDNGPGVPAPIAGRIWEPFFTTKPEGTGLGLAICRQIVESQGGTLTLETSSRGALFVIRLPVASAETPAKPAASAAPRRDRSGHVLVADDDSATREVLARMLAPYGLPVVQAGDFDAALAELRRRPPRLLLCDLHMPGGRGAMDFFRGLRRDNLLGATAVVIVSGFPPGSVVEDIIREEGWVYLHKPFEIDSFRKAVDPVLSG
ncbi:MAG: histidine kinase dimerization/phospho-acceptor domain-containing protein [Elusimicrobia bacterium]|nr:histidine kinase dimerization/phospho-acceptor domain-containing protein [Elusimicrobiota bacterium]